MLVPGFHLGIILITLKASLSNEGESETMAFDNGNYRGCIRELIISAGTETVSFCPKATVVENKSTDNKRNVIFFYR